VSKGDWSVDHLGRSLMDLLGSLRAQGRHLFLQQGVDTSTPSGRAMFQMLGVFTEFERSMIRERVMAGLSRAKADGIQLGRQRLEDTDADKVTAIVAARATGTGIRRIARVLGVGAGVAGDRRDRLGAPHAAGARTAEARSAGAANGGLKRGKSVDFTGVGREFRRRASASPRGPGQAQGQQIWLNPHDAAKVVGPVGKLQ
jgi:hypothetical protein